MKRKILVVMVTLVAFLGLGACSAQNSMNGTYYYDYYDTFQNTHTYAKMVVAGDQGSYTETDGTTGIVNFYPAKKTMKANMGEVPYTFSNGVIDGGSMVGKWYSSTTSEGKTLMQKYDAVQK